MMPDGVLAGTGFASAEGSSPPGRKETPVEVVPSLRTPLLPSRGRRLCVASLARGGQDLGLWGQDALSTEKGVS